MTDRVFRAGFAGLLGAALIAGCHSAQTEESYPKDPLLLSKKPVAGKATDGRSELLAMSEPAAPELPAVALASAPKSPASGSDGRASPSRLATSGRMVNAKPVAMAKQPLTASPAARTGNAAEASATPASRHVVDGVYGHSPDYTWLQGVLDRHYHGHMNLRFCDPTVEDPYGGKVCLVDDPRLSQFQEGDVVAVEGAMVPAEESTGERRGHHYPRYRIRDVQLIERKN
jgi:hypothetical protein